MSNKEIPSAGRAVYEGDTDRYEKGPSPQQENVGFRMGEPGDDPVKHLLKQLEYQKQVAEKAQYSEKLTLEASRKLQMENQLLQGVINRFVDNLTRRD